MARKKTNVILMFAGLLFILTGLCGVTAEGKPVSSTAKKPADSKHPTAAQKTSGINDLIDVFFKKRIGDLDEMTKHRQIRVLVVPSRSTYFLDEQGQPRGLDYDLLKRWEKRLNKNRKENELPVTLIFIPVTIEEIEGALRDGKGDIAGLSIMTPARTKAFAYTTPVFDQVKEVVVTRKGGPSFSKLKDLSGKEIYVVSGSAQAESLAAMNKRFQKQKIPPVKMVEAAPYVTQENLLEMVHGGMIQAALVPDAFANLWTRVFDDLVVHKSMPVSKGLKVGWAVRKKNPKLLKALNDAIATALNKDKKFFKKNFAQYFTTTRWITNPFQDGDKKDLPVYFRKEAAKFGIDWLRLMAQGFQESGLNNAAVSPVGAVGIMQVLPATAEDNGVKDYMDLDGNIRAGAKYMQWLMKRYAADKKIKEDDRFFFALAAYNSGPGNLNKYRKLAAKLGYDPNRWFGNVERACLRSGNLESVVYVRNILNYTMAYKIAYQQGIQ